MNTGKRKPRILAGFLTAALVLILGTGVPVIRGYASEKQTDTQTESETGKKIVMKSSIETPATPAGISQEESEKNGITEDVAAGEVQGLSLSTASTQMESEQAMADTGNTGMSMTEWIAALTISLTISGLILLGAGASLVYFFRRNWNRWGGKDDDE